MNKKIFFYLLLLLIPACKGSKGDKGDKGQAADITTYTGIISTDSQAISIPSSGGTVSVYVSNANPSNTYIQLPYYASAFSLNIYYDFNNSVLTIYNAKTTGLTNYKIVVLTASSSLDLYP